MFYINEIGGKITVPVYGILIDCAIDVSKRIANGTKIKKSELKTETIIAILSKHK